MATPAAAVAEPVADRSPASAADRAPAREPGARNLTRGTVLVGRLELAGSVWSRFKGLMGRRALAPDSGIFLPGTNGIHMMFMRFPIDAVFVGRPSADGEHPVLSVHRALRPWTGLVPLIRGAAGVLEVPAGAIDASATLPGDTLTLG